MYTTMGTNRVVLARRPKGVAEADGGCEEDGTAVVQEVEAMGEARDVVMTENDTMTTRVTAIRAGALTTNHKNDPASLDTVIQVDHCGAGDRGRTMDKYSLLARATERKWGERDQSFRIINNMNTKWLEGDMERERLRG